MYLKKHFDGDLEYISASDILRFMSEEDPKTRELYAFLYLVEQELNYFNYNTSTAFGNPDLTRIEGMVAGYCMAKGWTIEDTERYRVIKSGKRTKFVIERPKIPRHELDNRRDIRITRQKLGF